jgi:hypothetical protein
MKGFLFVILAIALSGTACAFMGKQALLAEDFRTEPVAIPLSLAEVNVIDRRTNVSPNKISIPVVSFGNEKRALSPHLSDEQKLLIQSELAQYFKGASRQVSATVEVLKAHQEFESGWKGERESVIVELKVTLIDQESQQPMGYSVGESSLWVQSMDASEDFVRKLYEKGLKMCIYHAARSLAKTPGQ